MLCVSGPPDGETGKFDVGVFISFSQDIGFEGENADGYSPKSCWGVSLTENEGGAKRMSAERSQHTWEFISGFNTLVGGLAVSLTGLAVCGTLSAGPLLELPNVLCLCG